LAGPVTKPLSPQCAVTHLHIGCYLINGPRRDERLSWPWYKVAAAEIRTRDLATILHLNTTTRARFEGGFVDVSPHRLTKSYKIQHVSSPSVNVDKAINRERDYPFGRPSPFT